METVRYGIIGIGNMGSAHAKNLFTGKIKNARLVAVCDIASARREWAKKNLPGVDIYENADAFFTATTGHDDIHAIDAVIIAVPHYFHPVYAIRAFSLGLNVLTEKPAGVYTKAVRQMNEAAEASGKVFGIMYNQRTNPVYRKVRELVKSGQLGEIKRVIWIITDWYRTQSYYNSSDWRATWDKEGGGVLLNQCPHQLDLWQWMFGMPVEIRSFMQYGKGRKIEVENDVTTYARYANGATGLFIASTHDAPGTNRLEISASMGKIIVERSSVTFYKNEMPEEEFNRTYEGGFGEPKVEVINIPITEEETGHNGILQNYTNAILFGEPLLAPGEEGILGLSLSNAMHLSDWTDHAAIDPQAIDEDLFFELLQKHIQESTFQKETKAMTLDTEGTY